MSRRRKGELREGGKKNEQNEKENAEKEEK
jgi:hypothetical protein